MSEPLADATTSSNATTSILLDGELPRLGGSAPATPAPVDPTPPAAPTPAPFAAPAKIPTSSPTAAPAMPAPAPSPRPAGPSPMLRSPGSAPILDSSDLPTLPSLPTAASPATPAARPTTPSPDPQPVAVATDLPTLPSLPTAASPAVHPAPAAPDDNPGTDESTPAPQAPSEHPMAHLMPQKNVPSEASRRAAGVRAAKKAKARKIKIGVAIGALVFAAVVGPPLGKWFVNALNESGSTSTEVEE